MIRNIISGGQTGVDRAALDAAIGAGLETGGWCPLGRVAEDGVIPEKYTLHETPEDRSPDAPDIPRSLRTEWNVRDSDATLILIPGKSKTDYGTNLTIICADKYNKPYLIVDPSIPEAVQKIRKWIISHRVRVLNIAGPSEHTSPGIYLTSLSFLEKLLATRD